MRFNPKARLDTSRINDAGGGGGMGGGMGGGGMRIPIPTGGQAGGGLTSLIIIILFIVLARCAGIDVTGGSGVPGASAMDSSRMAASQSDRYAGCKTGEDANNSEDCARVAVENSLFNFWSQALPQQANTRFQPETMTTFSGSVSTACGTASSQVGPFYCPADATIYLDTGFFRQVLQEQLGGPSGGFVEPYVLAHEYGHHIQNLLGTMGKVRTQQGPQSDAVRLELQADCYAGMWTHFATKVPDADGNVLIEELSQQDLDEAIAAAQSVGDDRIQEKTQGQVTQETWTHGSAASRAKWFNVGYEQGSLEACDTWAVETP